MIEWLGNHLGVVEFILVMIALCAVILAVQVTIVIGRLNYTEKGFVKYVTEHTKEHEMLMNSYDDLIKMDRDNRKQIYDELKTIGTGLAFLQGQLDNSHLEEILSGKHSK